MMAVCGGGSAPGRATAASVSVRMTVRPSEVKNGSPCGVHGVASAGFEHQGPRCVPLPRCAGQGGLQDKPWRVQAIASIAARMPGRPAFLAAGEYSPSPGRRGWRNKLQPFSDLQGPSGLRLQRQGADLALLHFGSHGAHGQIFDIDPALGKAAVERRQHIA